MFDNVIIFRVISIIGFLVTFVGIGVCCVAFPCHKECRWSPIEILKRLVHLLTLLFVEQKLSPLGVLKKLVYLLALLCFLVLAVTGFFQRLVLGRSISGYGLMLHATAAPVFAVCLAVIALLWAHHHRFSEGDCPWLQRILKRIIRPKTAGETLYKSSELLQKISFWLIVLLALPLILSIISSMFPLFGTHWQEVLLNVHRYSALLFALVVIVHTYLMVRTQMKD